MDICMHALKYRVWWVESSLGKWYWHESFLSRYFEPCGNLKLQACNLQWSTQYTQLPLDNSYQVIFNVISSHFACYTELSFSHLFFQFNIFRSIYQFIYQLVKLWWSNSLQMDASLTLMSTEKYIMWMKWNKTRHFNFFVIRLQMLQYNLIMLLISLKKASILNMFLSLLLYKE